MSECANESKDSIQNSSSPIRLTIRGLAHVPSFKNLKRVSGQGLFTKPRAAEWMRQCTDSFALQLLCAFRTRENATPMGRSRPSWIASVVPLDDSVQWIVEETIRVVKVAKGEEGADILIEPMRKETDER